MIRQIARVTPGGTDRLERSTRWIWVVAGLLLLSGFLYLAFRVATVPRYQGKTAEQWFPPFQTGGMLVFSVPPELTTGNLESLPVLIAATHLKEPSWPRWFRVFPASITKRIPAVVPGELTQISVSQAIAASVETSDRFARKLADRLEELSFDSQLRLGRITSVSSKAIVDARLRPILERKLVMGTPQEQYAAGFELLEWESLSEDTRRLLIKIAESLLNPAINRLPAKRDPEAYLERLGGMGPVSEALTEPLRRILPRLQAKPKFMLHLALCRLNPETFPASALFDSAADEQELFSKFEEVHFLFKRMSRNPHLSPNLGPILEACLRFRAPPGREEIVEREKVALLMEYAYRTDTSPVWAPSFLAGLDDASRRVRRAAAWTAYRINLRPSAVAEKAAELLEQGREPELMLMILAQSRTLPKRVSGLVRALAAGEPVAGWTPEAPPDQEVNASVRTATQSQALRQFAIALLVSAKDDDAIRWKAESTGGDR